MSKSGFIAVQSVTVVDDEGNERQVPDLGDSNITERVQRSDDGQHFYLSQGEDFLAFQRLGAIASRIVYFAVTNNPQRALDLVDRLGANAYSIGQALSNSTFRNWLRNNTSLQAIRRTSDNTIVGILPSVVLCGQNPISIGVPDQDPDETYEVVTI